MGVFDESRTGSPELSCNKTTQRVCCRRRRWRVVDRDVDVADTTDAVAAAGVEERMCEKPLDAIKPSPIRRQSSVHDLADRHSSSRATADNDCTADLATDATVLALDWITPDSHYSPSRTLITDVKAGLFSIVKIN